MQLRLFCWMLVTMIWVAACQPIQPVATPVTTPLASSTPDLTGMQTESWFSTAPDEQWTAIGLVALPQPGGDQYYTELRVKKADGNSEWAPVAGWSNFGLGYTTPRPLQWSPDGRYLYFTNAPVADGCALFVNASDLQRLDLTDGSVKAILPPNTTWSLALAPDGKTVAYQKGDELYLLDLETMNDSTIKVEKAEPNAQWGNFVWTPDSQKVAFTIAYQPCLPPEWSHSLLVMDTQSATLTTVIEKDPRRLSIVGWMDAQHLLLTDTERALWLLDMDAGAITAPTHCIPTESIQCLPSPDGQWMVEINQTQGISLHAAENAQVIALFSPAETIGSIVWSPDSHSLIAVRNNWRLDSAGTVQPNGLPQLWQVTLHEGQVSVPTLVFDPTQTVLSLDEMGAGQIVLGDWSPSGQYLLFWVGPLSASVQADGLPFLVLEPSTGQTTLLADTALLNPRYHSWAPDESALAFTAGGYRSAQVNKWLNVWDVASGQMTTVVSQTEQIPGMVAWSPRGDWLAYAAVPASETGAAWADLMTFENPAIAGRRIYLLNPATGEQRRLNDGAAFQDAPVWSIDGKTLAYVQRDGEEIVLMVADPVTGQATAIEASRQPLPAAVGYYGQGEWDAVINQLPASAP